MAKLEEHLKKLVLPGGGARFSGADLREWLMPIVYVFVKDGHPLYVGYSRNGIARVFGRHHKSRARAECDEVMVFPVASVKDAQKLEQILIFNLKPEMNGQMPYQGEAHEVLGISKRRAAEIKKRRVA